MADGGLTLHLNEPLSSRLETAAASAGQKIEDYAQALIQDVLDAEAPDEDWAEDEARWAEFERTGESYPLEDVLREFREGLAQEARHRDLEDAPGHSMGRRQPP